MKKILFLSIILLIGSVSATYKCTIKWWKPEVAKFIAEGKPLGWIAGGGEHGGRCEDCSNAQQPICSKCRMPDHNYATCK